MRRSQYLSRPDHRSRAESANMPVDASNRAPGRRFRFHGDAVVGVTDPWKQWILCIRPVYARARQTQQTDRQR
jgi:hypothetical protein